MYSGLHATDLHALVCLRYVRDLCNHTIMRCGLYNHTIIQTEILLAALAPLSITSVKESSIYICLYLLVFMRVSPSLSQMTRINSN